MEFGFTQDISARGAFFYTDCPLSEGSSLQLTLTMPAEITLTENLRVACHGEAIRVERLADGIRSGVAVRLHDYEFLAAEAPEDRAVFDRICSLHPPASDVSSPKPAPSGRAVT